MYISLIHECIESIITFLSSVTVEDYYCSNLFEIYSVRSNTDRGHLKLIWKMMSLLIKNVSYKISYLSIDTNRQRHDS